MRGRRLRAIVAFEFRRRWYGGRLPVALVLVAVGSLAAGWGVQAGHLFVPDAVDLDGYLYLVALVLVFRFDLAHDMDLGFADVMAPGLVGVDAFLGARLAAGVASVAQFALPAAFLTTLAPGLDVRFALWTGSLWVLLALSAAPAVLLAELWLRTRLPVLAVAGLALLLLLAAAGMGAVEGILRVLGTRWIAYGSFPSLAPLARRAGLVGMGGLVILAPLVRRHWSPR